MKMNINLPKRLLLFVLTFTILLSLPITAFAIDDNGDYEYNGNITLENYDDSNIPEIERDETYEYPILAESVDGGYNNADTTFTTEYSLSVSINSGTSYVSRISTSTKSGEVYLNMTTRDTKASKDQTVSIKVTATPKKSSSGYSTTVSYFDFKFLANDDNNSSSNGSNSSSDDYYIDDDEYDVPMNQSVKLEFDNSVRKCTLYFEDLAKYTVKLGKKDTFTIEYNDDENNYVYNLNDFDDDEELFFLNFEKNPKFEFEDDLYIYDHGCKYLYTIDSKGYAEKLSPRHSGDWFIIKKVDQFEKNYVITDEKLKEKKSSSSGSSSSSSSNKNSEKYEDTITSKAYKVPIDKNCTLEFDSDLFQSQLQFGGLALYTAKLGKTTKFNIEYNDDVNKYVYHVNGLSESSPIHFLNFVKSPKFEFGNDLYIKNYGCSYLYTVDNNGYATKLNPSISNGWFVLKDVTSFDNYAITNYNLKSKNGDKTTSSSSSTPSKTTSTPSKTTSSSSNSSKVDTSKKDDKKEEETKKEEIKTNLQPSTTITLNSTVIKEALEKTPLGGTATVYIANNDVLDVKELKRLMKKHKSKLIVFAHKVGHTIEYQIILNNRQVQKIKYDTLAVGMDTTALDTAYTFAKYYSNDFYWLRHNNYIGSGAVANFAVKLNKADLEFVKKIESTLRLYWYDSNNNHYEQIANPYIWIDSKGYLHFTAEVGYDYLFSSGVIQKR